MADLLIADIGGRLRDARLQRGMSLADAADRTKLPIAMIQAIERNDFASLPPGMYRKAYVRSLAKEVGLDPAAIAAAYDQHYAPATESPAVARSKRVPEDEWVAELAPSPRRSVATLIILIALAAGWFARSNPVTPADAITEAAVEPIAAYAPVLASAPVMVEATTPLADPAAPPRMDGPLRIEISAGDWCWVAAESDGQRVIYRLLEPGERVVLDGQRQISLRLGDAGSVSVSIGGGPPQSLGGDGEVVELHVTPANIEELRNAAAHTPSSVRLPTG